VADGASAARRASFGPSTIDLLKDLRRAQSMLAIHNARFVRRDRGTRAASSRLANTAKNPAFSPWRVTICGSRYML